MKSLADETKAVQHEIGFNKKALGYRSTPGRKLRGHTRANPSDGTEKMIEHHHIQVERKQRIEDRIQNN
jgi:hypothetical protein